jgi:diadenosine tetraphosphate (Ap4A) HIT family hydrolase
VSDDWRTRRVQAALDGSNPAVLAQLRVSFAVIGDVQFLPGYCVVLTKKPGISRLSDLSRAERIAFLADVDLVATAVETVCTAFDPACRRVNIEIEGNLDAFLHAHVWPRYSWEVPQRAERPVWLYPASRWSDPACRLGPRQDALRLALADEIARLRDSPEFSMPA